MGATGGQPSLLPPVLPPNIGQDQTKEALDFAGQLADREIASIERIHNRTLVSFGYIGVFAATVLAIFSYIGYSNLKTAAIAAAQDQMKLEVTRQVKDQLTKENINQIVRDQIRDYSATSLTAEIHRDLTTPPLSTSIKQVADDKAEELIRKQFSPRHFSATQSKQLIDQLANMKELYDYPIGVNPAPLDDEAKHYANEIKESLSHTNMKWVDNVSFNSGQVDGVGIYYQMSRSESYAIHLRDALEAAGVHATMVPSWIVSPLVQSADAKVPLEIFIGTKPMR